ncbi:argininosuccinate lyase [Neocloeon triangulifer]|uniref:argininosuccinate lyase n=1 Tax=Neocloeon triangulifer TaxID=2078957 RepID=UPI00286EE069|nr:argininosuccinate lyase [Neocloeon triangulifer]
MAEESTKVEDDKKNENRLWGGRFSTSRIHQCLEKINNSIEIDHRLHKQDIKGSLAYASGLKDAGNLTDQERNLIVAGLKKIEEEWAEDEFQLYQSDEDIHTAVERRLKELIGPLAGKLHTGRSRNDQVATDTKLWLKDESEELTKLLSGVIMRMAKKAEEQIDVLMPGYTHLQKAQPVRWSHWLLSHAWALNEDRQRLAQIVERTMSRCPLGSGALAGTPLALDRSKVAQALGFTGVSENSMHAVADRDFVAEFTFWSALTSVHLSRMAEDLLLHCSLGFAKMGPGLSTGSSLMPHKSNPDGVELLRAKGATLTGLCTSMLALLKGLPSTYNKDLQLDKSILFQAHDDLKLSLELTYAVIDTLQVDRINCLAALEPSMLATDLAYYLVHKGIPFREAHNLVGTVVRLAEQKKIEIKDISIIELKEISPLFDEDVLQVWSYESSVEQYKAFGGTSKSSVEEQIVKIKTQNHTE